ncbi:hypothetical protein CAL7716_100420 (plasmid) [Calothrix sp. PCC 7716]|nr:hypothetical protein CAL7716_100420 [Calothrix sp. PCC 7716]
MAGSRHCKLSDFSNVNVCVWAKPAWKDGTQARFNLECESIISLEAPNKEFAEVWGLFFIENLLDKGESEQDILDQIHGFYRIPAPIQNPFY